MNNLEKLEKLLKRIKKKQYLSQPLTPQERNLVAELERQQKMSPTEKISLNHDGSVTFSRSHNVSPIFDGVKQLSDVLPRSHAGPAGSKYVGSIDNLTALNWSKEWGVKLYSKEFNQLAAKRLKEDADYSKFRYQPVH